MNKFTQNDRNAMANGQQSMQTFPYLLATGTEFIVIEIAFK